MTLYRYIGGREELLSGVVDSVIDGLHDDPELHLNVGSWQDYLTRLAHGVRRTALTHPQVFRLVATGPPATPWTRPPLRSLRWLESFLRTMHNNGFTEPNAVSTYRAFSSFLIGHLRIEISASAAASRAAEHDRPPAPSPDALLRYPSLTKFEPALTADHLDEQFSDALSSLIQGLDKLS